MWHDAVSQDDIRGVPLYVDADADGVRSTEGIVEILRSLPGALPRSKAREKREGRQRSLQSAAPLFSDDRADNALSEFGRRERDEYIGKLEAKLDDEVFRLFGLSEAERDLVDEMCNLGLDYMYRGRRSKAVAPLRVEADSCRFGGRGELIKCEGIGEELREYIRVFLDLWEPHLTQHKGWFRWRIVLSDSDATMLAIIFSTESTDDQQSVSSDDDQSTWTWILSDLAASCGQLAWARDVYIDGMLRLVTSNDIVIVKRNERRLWTRTAARATCLLICPPKSHFGGAVVWRIWMEWVGAPRRVVVEAQ